MQIALMRFKRCPQLPGCLRAQEGVRRYDFYSKDPLNLTGGAQHLIVICDQTSEVIRNGRAEMPEIGAVIPREGGLALKYNCRESFRDRVILAVHTYREGRKGFGQIENGISLTRSVPPQFR